ncbi:MAG TPA: YceI family protein, partial [Solirubrobacterales bacterium]|nr:YceI family protein [Solirubrobacterales bacterium]
MSTDTVNKKVPTGTWTVDPVHSTISFAVTHNNVATFRSGFGSYEATLVGGDEAKLEGSVDVSSIDIDDAQLKGHLMTPDF